ncbi:hypothetical protein [Acidicapsa ligni]|uniref:hypothetical protein n=1 Tax=Acidicapsa ligni TaxID=542300 RepID=UPI0021E04788|nr:hypothetical protein [Acidicapsa ligni]
MKVISTFGRILFAAAIIGFGIQHFLCKGVVVGVELVPPWPPSHIFWGYLIAILLLLCGLSIAFRKAAVIAALLLAILFFNAVVVLDLPKVLARVMDLTERTRFFESLSLGAGALIIAGGVVIGSRGLSRALHICAMIGSWLFAISLIIFGTSHFLVPSFIATLIPKWIQWHLFWAWFTGIAFVAAGVAILLRRYAATAACMLGIMFLAWVAVLHAPRIYAALHSTAEWNSGLVALGMAGCSFALCSSTAVRRRL